MEHPERVRRRLVPDRPQLQIILGSLLGGAPIEGEPGERCMLITHGLAQVDYVWWKYERLTAFTAAPPAAHRGRIGFRTIAHPLFDDLAVLLESPRRRGVRALIAPLGLAVWMTDAGRLELRPELFLPAA